MVSTCPPVLSSYSLSTSSHYVCNDGEYEAGAEARPSSGSNVSPTARTTITHARKLAGLEADITSVSRRRAREDGLQQRRGGDPTSRESDSRVPGGGGGLAMGEVSALTTRRFDGHGGSAIAARDAFVRRRNGAVPTCQR